MTTRQGVPPLPAEDDTLQMISALWTGYISAIERIRGPKLILNVNDVEAMVQLREIAITQRVQAHVAEVAGRAPPPCPDLDGEVWNADRADGHRKPCECVQGCAWDSNGTPPWPGHYCKAAEEADRGPVHVSARSLYNHP